MTAPKQSITQIPIINSVCSSRITCSFFVNDGKVVAFQHSSLMWQPKTKGTRDELWAEKKKKTWVCQEQEQFSLHVFMRLQHRQPTGLWFRAGLGYIMQTNALPCCHLYIFKIIYLVILYSIYSIHCFINSIRLDHHKLQIVQWLHILWFQKKLWKSHWN